jgi:hypothetical protein
LAGSGKGAAFDSCKTVLSAWSSPANNSTVGRILGEKSPGGVSSIGIVQEAVLAELEVRVWKVNLEWVLVGDAGLEPATFWV